MFIFQINFKLEYPLQTQQSSVPLETASTYQPVSNIRKEAALVLNFCCHSVIVRTLNVKSFMQ